MFPLSHDLTRYFISIVRFVGLEGKRPSRHRLLVFEKRCCLKTLNKILLHTLKLSLISSEILHKSK